MACTRYLMRHPQHHHWYGLGSTKCYPSSYLAGLLSAINKSVTHDDGHVWSATLSPVLFQRWVFCLCQVELVLSPSSGIYCPQIIWCLLLLACFSFRAFFLFSVYLKQIISRSGSPSTTWVSMYSYSVSSICLSVSNWVDSSPSDPSMVAVNYASSCLSSTGYSLLLLTSI